MLAAFYAGRRILITLPLLIAMTARSGLVILQGKEADPIVLVDESGAIVPIAIACWILGRADLDR